MREQEGTGENVGESVIEMDGITKIYRTGEEDTLALAGVDLNVEAGDFVAIMGPSGSGKSTLMNIIGLLDTPSTGQYKLKGSDVSGLKKNRQAEIRNSEIGFVFQQFNLLPRTTVMDNVMLPTLYSRVSDAARKARRVIEEVGLTDRMYHKSNQLSGGQIQRVAIARALIMDPSIILADEPTGNLDTTRSHELMELLKGINERGSTIVLITHEQEIAAYARRVIKLRDGKIIEDTGAAA
jgi:putative ABC transport system ATP-binding protein